MTKVIERFPTNAELARKTGLSESAISRILSGEREVSVQSGAKLMAALELDSWDALFAAIATARESRSKSAMVAQAQAAVAVA